MEILHLNVLLGTALRDSRLLLSALVLTDLLTFVYQHQMTKPAALLQTRNTITATDHQQGDKVFLQASQNNPGNLF